MKVTTASVSVLTLGLLLGCAGGTPAKYFENKLDNDNPNTAYQIVLEPEFDSKSWSDVENAVRRFAELKVDWFEGVKGAKIHYRQYTNLQETRGGIVISSGRTEGLALYQETIYDLVRNGYSVYIHDHRGQGFSSRLLDKEHKTNGHVENFSHYVDDLAKFITIVKSARNDDGNGRPLFLLAHSMGGAIASLYLQRPESASFKAAALVTPMHQPWAAGENTPKISFRDLVSLTAQSHCDTADSELKIEAIANKCAADKPFDEQFEAFKMLKDKDLETNSITHSVKRYKRNWEARAAKCVGEYCANEDAKVGCPTFRWFNQACAASATARGERAKNVSIPLLVLQGQDDKVVHPARQVEFCDNVNRGNVGGGYCVGYVVPQARHALFIEEDQLRRRSLIKILSFFDCVGEGKAKCR